MNQKEPQLFQLLKGEKVKITLPLMYNYMESLETFNLPTYQVLIKNSLYQTELIPIGKSPKKISDIE